MPRPTAKHYNVLLSYPDYLTGGDLETYCAVGIPADTAAEAIQGAQLMALGDNLDYDEAHPTDFAPLLVFHGQISEESWDAH